MPVKVNDLSRWRLITTSVSQVIISTRHYERAVDDKGSETVYRNVGWVLFTSTHLWLQQLEQNEIASIFLVFSYITFSIML